MDTSSLQDKEMTCSTVAIRPDHILDEEKCNTLVVKKNLVTVLNEKQLLAYKKIIEEKKSVLITGSAGTGKTKCLTEIIAGLNPSTTYITAATGTAALPLNATTLHSFAGIGLGEDKIEDLLKRVYKNKNALERWKQVETLIIDEISMIQGELLDKLNHIAQSIKRNNLPFGNIQLVLVGDFLQLPPVSKDKKVKFCFESECWSSCINEVIELTETYRQNDPIFIEALQEIRIGKKDSKKLINLFKPCINRTFDTVKDGIEPTSLYAKRVDVENENHNKLNALTTKEYIFTSIDEGDEFLMKNINVPQEIKLKIGAQVMLTKNLSQSEGLVNGSRAIVIDFVKGTNVLNKKRKVMTLLSGTKNIKPEDNFLPLVKFVNGLERVMFPEEWKIEEKGKSLKFASRTQIPLILAWAITIHKIQGASLDRVKLHMDGIFDSGQAYVSLSRVRSLEGLSLTQMFPVSVIMTDERALAFYGIDNNNKVVETINMTSSKIVFSTTKLQCNRHKQELIIDITANTEVQEIYVCNQGCKLCISTN